MSKRFSLVLLIWLFVGMGSHARGNPVATENLSTSSKPLQTIVQDMLWLTEQYPPFHFKQGQKKQGFAIDILNEIFSSNQIVFNSNRQIFVFPWARALKEISTNPNAALLTMAYTEERDKLYVLSEPLFTEKVVLLSLQQQDTDITDLQQIENMVVGVVRDDIGERLLKDLGPDELHLTHVLSSRELLQMLIRERVDAIAYSLDIIQYQLKQLSNSQYQVKVHKVLAELPTSIAFNKQVDPALLKMVNDSIVALKANGTIDRILSQ